MNHVNLDSQAENVRQFLLSLTRDPNGTFVDWNGQAVACVVPMPVNNGPSDQEWSEAKNLRRWELIEKKHKQGPLTAAEIVELAELQQLMLRYRQKVAPLPLDDARRLHDELLQKAASVKNSLPPGRGRMRMPTYRLSARKRPNRPWNSSVPIGRLPTRPM